MSGSTVVPPSQEADAYYRENMQYSGLGDHFHYFHELILVKSGAVEFTINGHSYVARTNDLIMIGNLEHHENRALEYPYNAYLLSASNDLCLLNIREPQLLSMLLHHTGGHSPLIPLDEKAAGRISGFMDEAVRECDEKPPFWTARVALLLTEILLESYRSDPERFSSQNTNAIDAALRAQKYVAANYASKITLDDVSEQCFISKYHFSRIFKEVTGYGFQEYLTLYRLNEAKKLLCGTDSTITKICYDVGYGNINHFIRIFRSQLQISPLQYRKLYRRLAADDESQRLSG